jgi:hypothetical protein
MHIRWSVEISFTRRVVVFILEPFYFPRPVAYWQLAVLFYFLFLYNVTPIDSKFRHKTQLQLLIFEHKAHFTCTIHCAMHKFDIE